MTTRLLEVIVTDAADARAAAAGGADRLELIAAAQLGGMTPPADTLRDVLDATALPVRVMLRRTAQHRLTPDDLDELRGDVDSLPMATEFVCGAVNSAGFPDAALRPVVDAMGGRAWTFHRAIDEAPDLARGVRDALRLPGCDQVLTAGSVRGVDAGLDRLLPLLADSELRAGLLIGGGVTVAHLPALLERGVRAIHLGRAVRQGNSWHAPVDTGLVRAAADLVHEASVN